MEDLCYLNGEVLPVADARIHPLDRGFLFGDALYEVIKVRDGRLFELEAHLDRMAGTLLRTGIGSANHLDQACRELVAAAGLAVGFIYVQVTRGVAPRTHLPPAGMTPTVFILPAEFDYAEPAGRQMHVVIQDDRRWGNCDIKTTSLMATVLGKISAEESGADENLVSSETGEIREGGQTNFFVRRGDVLETHPADRRILPGVTRQLLLRFTTELGIPTAERAPRLEERGEWQEALLCGTLTGVQPVVRLDGEEVAGGTCGDWTRQLAEAHERYEQAWLARPVQELVAR